MIKEERNVKISLDKAREWYNRGGEYKELALSAFTENEITISALPNSWEEFCDNYPIKEKEYFIAVDCTINEIGDCQRISNGDKNILPSLKSAEAHLAYMQLEQLRDCYRQGWLPDWSDGEQNKYIIFYNKDKYTVDLVFRSRRFLAFQSRKIAEKFFNNFQELINLAGDLI